ncbi:hypothetical protein PoB_001911600 [Plakobranchus ocellatus]|uniref:Lysozyme n=1 Tax=Plakobranchus ocellatus TaxID=259542 RepID=A0AAV3Z9L0_9GAST|nr:hypothetical protein PoB_001911600 [Plakobranchus ocellatus]
MRNKKSVNCFDQICSLVSVKRAVNANNGYDRIVDNESDCDGVSDGFVRTLDDDICCNRVVGSNGLNKVDDEGIVDNDDRNGVGDHDGAGYGRVVNVPQFVRGLTMMTMMLTLVIMKMLMMITLFFYNNDNQVVQVCGDDNDDGVSINCCSRNNSCDKIADGADGVYEGKSVCDGHSITNDIVMNLYIAAKQSLNLSGDNSFSVSNFRKMLFV